jgi:two-component system OmpR family sensor kinase
LKRYEKNAFFRFFTLFFAAFMLMFILLGTLYYLQEHTRLNKELELTSQMNYIECMKLDMGDDCSQKKETTPDMMLVKKDILYALGLVLLLFIPISLLLSLFSIRPVRQASTMIDNFIANIVHDINTPIATIMLNSKSLLKKTQIAPKKLQLILSSAKQLSDMQHDLLALADEKNEIEKEEIEVNSTVEEIVEEFRLRYATQPFEVSVEEQVIVVNGVDFRRIIQNLLSNAVKYNRDEHLISIYSKENLLVIEDRGKGMEHPEKVFEKNYREDYSIQGNGLGLASVLAMINRNEINIEVSSSINLGTIIKLNFSH